MPRTTAALLGFALVSGCRSARPASVQTGALSITPGYATASPRGDGGAAYFVVRNGGAEPDTLVAVTVDSAAEATLHATRASGGLMRMEPLTHPPINPRDSLVLTPGATHLMFSGFARPRRVGDTVTVALQFAHAPAVRIRLPVRPYGG